MVKIGPIPFEKHARAFALASHRNADLQDVRKELIDSADTGASIFASGHSVDFARAVRARSIIGRLPGVLSVPINVDLPFLSAGTQAAFRGEGQPASVSAAELGDPVNLFPHSVSALVVVTAELLRHSESEGVLRRDMINALAEAIDQRLLDPAADLDSEATGPAAITSGLTAIDASDVSDAPGVDALVSEMIYTLIAAGSTLENAAFIAPPTVALGLSLLRPLDLWTAIPTVSVLGGSLHGLPLLVTASAPPESLTLVDGSDLMVGDRQQANIGHSKTASIDMSSAPEGDRRVSMYQTDSVALRVSREISWRLRQGFVSYAEGLSLPLPVLPSEESSS